jgi:hypothetical protein
MPAAWRWGGKIGSAGVGKSSKEETAGSWVSAYGDLRADGLGVEVKTGRFIVKNHIKYRQVNSVISAFRAWMTIRRVVKLLKSVARHKQWRSRLVTSPLTVLNLVCIGHICTLCCDRKGGARGIEPLARNSMISIRPPQLGQG